MSLAKELHLWIDVDASRTASLVKVTGTTINQVTCPPLMQGDKYTLALHFGRQGNAGWEVVQIDGGDSIVLEGLKQDYSGSPLFSVDGFTEAGTGADLRYEGTLDLSGNDLGTALVSAELAVRFDIAVEDASLRARVQVDATVRKQVYSGVPSDIEGGVQYYTKAQVDAMLAAPTGHAKLEGGWLKLWDRGTSAYRKVELENGALIVVAD
jgi:hypothetical protein